MLHESRWAPPDGVRTALNVHPDAGDELRKLLTLYPEMQGVGHSEFVMRAVRQTVTEIAHERSLRAAPRDWSSEWQDGRPYLIRIRRHPTHAGDTTATDFVKINAPDDCLARDRAMIATRLRFAGHRVEYHECLPLGNFRELRP